MKLLSKSLITIFATVILAQGLEANTTICYKKNWKSPSTIETTKLDGGECNGNLSFKDMQKKGWYLKDIKIERTKDGLNYSYILTDKKLVDINNSTFMDNKYTKLDYKPMATRITNVTDENATINIGNLRTGQSAIIQHNYENSKTLIVSNAYVIKSNETSSTLKFIPFLDIKQNAIPTSNRAPENGDIAILNYLYDASLIIAPSQDAFTATRTKYRDNNFLHSDLFGAKLKIEREPLPSKEIIQEFAIEQNLGTIFFIIGSKVYVVDSKTFAILDEDTISYNFVESEKMPFYTRVEKIEKSEIEKLLNWKNIVSLKFLDFLDDDKRTEEEQLLEDEIESGELVLDGAMYNNYYKTILGINK
ncbi:plasminogen-binding N-terminal domain-containing protein [Arcobacter sp. LA11]|uniref:plasminogen-binding N-terminal domain-containing protein n=1 Tax=Arcobacter sp. LA11 TaxID=1898176 RepID=UPI0009341477|nr:plasminogen-binding N-terminal domain-containing protein [Arcobacter sp. LA11]